MSGLPVSSVSRAWFCPRHLFSLTQVRSSGLSGFYPGTPAHRQVHFTKGSPFAPCSKLLSIISVIGLKSVQQSPVNQWCSLPLCPIYSTILSLICPSLTQEIQILLLPLPKQFSSPAPHGANTKAFHCSEPALLSRHLVHFIFFCCSHGLGSEALKRQGGFCLHPGYMFNTYK